MFSLRLPSRHVAHFLCLGLGLALLAPAARAGGGNIMPPSAKPDGYSLADMSEALAYFTSSGNNSAYYPDTPFQILYIDYATGSLNFTVDPGTKFFVPVFGIDDSPPIWGDFPSGPAGVRNYLLSDEEVGVKDAEIVVDGKATSLSADYAAYANTPGLLDGGGNHFIQVGAFLTPLTKGTHTVTIRVYADGDAIDPIIPGGVWSFEVSYTVTVR